MSRNVSKLQSTLRNIPEERRLLKAKYFLHDMKAYVGLELQLQSFLNSLFQAEWSASVPGSFTPGERPRDVQSRSGTFGEEKNICPFCKCIFLSSQAYSLVNLATALAPVFLISNRWNITLKWDTNISINFLYNLSSSSHQTLRELCDSYVIFKYSEYV
jgi:hypothetical protein